MEDRIEKKKIKIKTEIRKLDTFLLFLNNRHTENLNRKKYGKRGIQ